MSLEDGGGLPIPVSVESGQASLILLERIATAVENVGKKTDDAAKKTEDASKKTETLFGGIVDGAKQASEAYTYITSAVSQFVSTVNEVIERMAALASEQAHLDETSAQLGLNFDQAAEAAGRFSDETESMNSASQFAAHGIRLTQQELDALERMAGHTATTLHESTEQAVTDLTTALINGKEHGLAQFGPELARLGGNSHTVGERLAELVRQAGRVEAGFDDATTATARFKDKIEDMTRTFASGFVEGVENMARLGEETSTAAEHAEDLQRSIRGVGAAMGETLTRVATGVSLVLGFVAVGVGGILAGLTAIGGGLEHLASGHVQGLGAAMSAASDTSFMNSAGDFVSRQLSALNAQSDATDEQRTSLAVPTGGPSRATDTAARNRRGGATPQQDAETQRIMARAQLAHDAAERERADLERLITVRRREIEMQQMLASTTSEQLDARVRLGELTGRIAVSERDVDNRQLERLHEIIGALQERATHLSGRQLTTAQHDLNGLLAEEVALHRRVEDAVHSVARANAERYAAERHAMDQAAANDNAREESRRSAARVFAGPTNDYEIASGRPDTLNDQLERVRNADPETARARRAVSREQREQQQRLDSLQTFTERWRDLHSQQVDATREAAEGLSGAFASMGSAFAKHAEAFTAGRETIGAALKGMLADTLASIGKEAWIKSGFFLAEGIAKLVMYDLPGAGLSFAASAAYAAVGAASMAGSTALAPAESAKPTAAPAAPSGGRADRPLSSGKQGSGGDGQTVIYQFYAPVIGGRDATDAQVGAHIGRYGDAVSRRQVRVRPAA